MSTHTPLRRALIGSLAAGLVATPLALGFTAPAQAAPSTGLVISEVYGGGGNTGATYTNDFIELYNPTSSPISVDGMSVQYRSATGNTAALTNLTGSVPAGGHYLVQEAAGTTVTDKPLPTPDATGTLAMSGSNGVVILASNTTPVTAVGNFAGSGNPANVIDTVGYGTTPTTFETTNTAVALTNSTSAQRTSSGSDTDANAPDFTEAAPTPVNAAAGGGPVTPGDLTATNPGDKTYTVDQAIPPFTLAASGGTAPYTWAATGLPTGLTISPGGTVSGTPTATGTSSVTATATDSATPADTASTAFTITVSAAQGVTPIAEIQGTGATSPVTGTVTTEGVVTASYPTGGLNGFYLQTPGADTANASDAIFVYGGTTGFATYPAVGDSVRVTGTVGEFQTATQLTATNSQYSTVAALGTVTPKSQIPGADCALPGNDCLSLAALDTAREVTEGELFQPAGSYTATDVYDFGPAYNDGSNGTVNRGEIALAANSTKPLVAPTEVINAQDTALRNERTAYNRAHRILLDDASSLSFSTTANSDKPFPWVTETYATRVGAAVTFPAPVVFTQGFNGSWRLLPTSQVVGQPSATQPQFRQTRAQNLAPQPVGGDVKLATFNVLNFFPTTGEAYVAANLGSCTYYTDRTGTNRISVNQCNPDGPRGAANEANLVRQRDKIVAAITTSGADVVSLEELENSVKFGKDRDFAINALVSALNSAPGVAAGTWAAVPSPAASELPPLSEQDVIRNGFIYKPGNVALVGSSDVLEDQSTGTEAFADAREPVAQAFKKVGTPDAEAFAVIVNHFKSKGSGTPDPDGQGNANDRRVLQANALATFADQFKTARGISRVFLAGDFNAYSEEDPIQALEAKGYTALKSSSNPEEESYNFDGQVGSLDHVLANDAALADVNAVDIWEINGNESVYYEYARFNTNVTNLYAPNPFRSSDHSPEIVGINVADAPAPVDVQILATNDFHGRIANDPTSSSAGAAVLAGAVKQFRAANPATSFVAAGDLIGASTFESFIQKDKPTIDALNEAGLDVSAVGNHEFDQGYDDLVNRVMAPYDAETNPFGGAGWKYIGANVKFRDSGNPALDPSYVMNQGGVQVGYIGAVTEQLPSLVSPAGISNIQVTNIANAVNAEAEVLKSGGADLIVLLVHEGASSTDCTTITTDTTSDFGRITSAVNGNIDAIVSGHTHLVYNCSQAVPSWANRPVKERPIVSAGQYGSNLNKLNYSVDPTTGAVLTKAQTVLPLKTGQTANYPADAATQAIVTEAVNEANVIGAEPIGQIDGAVKRAFFSNGTTENRGGESSLGNLVAEIQRAQTAGANQGGAQIAFMNPGGLRADLNGQGTGAYPRTITYKDAANVQPFANTLVNEDLTGAEIKAALEQQWQPAGASRPFLKLGISKGFSYTYDPAAAQGSRITAMFLNGNPVSLTDTYSVTVNSFLATGGDSFAAFNGKARKVETGITDLQAQVDYFAALGTTTPLSVDYSQRSVGARNFSADPTGGQPFGFELSSLSMTAPGDVTDTAVDVTLDGQLLGSFPVTTVVGTGVPGADEAGTATVSVVLPESASGAKTLVVTGNRTGTAARVPVTIAAAPVVAVDTTTTATAATVDYGQDQVVNVTVAAVGGDTAPTGTVALFDGERLLGTASLVDGKAGITIPARTFEVGSRELQVRYAGGEGFNPSDGTVTVDVTKAATTTRSTVSPSAVTVLRSRNTFTVTVAASGYTPTGTVEIRSGGKVLGSGELNDDGRTSVRVGPYKVVGTFTITVAYLGDTRAGTSFTTVPVKVVKQTPTMTVTTVSSAREGTQPTVKVALAGTGGVPTGRVAFTVNGRTATITLVGGKAQYKLPRITKDTAVTVRYNGSTTFNTVAKRVVIRLR